MKKVHIKILNIVVILLIILIFEFGYCNHTFTENLMKNGEITTFYISVCRIICYILILVIGLIFNYKNDFEKTKESLNTKMKKIILAIWGITSLIILVFPACASTTIYMTDYALTIILLLTSFIAIIYFSKEHTKNIILIGIIASIFTISTDTYHEIDEKKYFMQSYNMSYFNFDFSNPIVDTMFMYKVVPRDRTK